MKHKAVFLSQPKCKLYHHKDVGLNVFNSTKSPVTEYLENVTLHTGRGVYEGEFCAVPNTSVPFLLADDFIKDYNVRPKCDQAAVAL